MSLNGLSLVDIAEIKLKEAKEPMNVYDLYDKICEEKDASEEEKNQYIAQFYADITTSAKFVYVGENTWDLKDNQKTDLWEKDGSYYKEYNEVVIPEEYLVKPKAKAAPTPVVAKVVEEVKPEVIEEPVVVKEEPKVQEAVKVEPVKGTIDPKSDDIVSEEFDEDLFDDFDEEKYNEYMDNYEDQYDD